MKTKNLFRLSILSAFGIVVFLQSCDFSVLSGIQGNAFTIKVANSSGTKIKDLLGVNVGPTPYNDGDPDLTTSYQDYGVKAIRTHDYYGPLDMTKMYRDYSADPKDCKSFTFANSDKKFKGITDGGFDVYFRLGDSFGLARPPQTDSDRANWIEAAKTVIAHYTEGECSGMHATLRGIEIWNEPSNTTFWPSPLTADDFNVFYTETAQALKDRFPNIKIGGPGLEPSAILTSDGKKTTETFLKYVKDKNAPLDFLSWHMYSAKPETYRQAITDYREKLTAAGFPSDTEQHITEWNTDDETLRDKALGAAVLTGAWIVLQQEGMTESYFYRGMESNPNVVNGFGLFRVTGEPKTIGSAFKLWAKLVKGATAFNDWTASSGDKGTISIAQKEFALAGLYLHVTGNKSSGHLLMSNINSKTYTATLDAAVNLSSAKLIRIDSTGLTESSLASKAITLGPESVVYVEW